MDERDPQPIATFLAREWPYLAAALIVFSAALGITITRSLHTDRPAQRKPAAPPADSRRLDQLMKRPAPLTAAAVGSTLLAFVVGSAVWLIARRRDRGLIFPPTGLTRPRWNEWDVIKLIFLFLLLLGALLALLPPSASVAAYGLASLLTVLAALDVVRRRGHDPAEALGLRLRGLAPHMVPGLAVFFTFLPVFFALNHLWRGILQRLGGGFDAPQEPVEKLASSPSLALVTQIVIAAVLVAPVAEELFFRGLLYGLVRRRIRPALAMVAVGVLFGVFHSPLGAAVPMCVFGIFLCYLYEKTARLTVPITAHFIFNLFQVALIVLYRFT